MNLKFLEVGTKWAALAALGLSSVHCGSSDSSKADFDRRSPTAAEGGGAGDDPKGDAGGGADGIAQGGSDSSSSGDGNSGARAGAGSEGGGSSEGGGAGEPSVPGDQVAPEVSLSALPQPIINDTIGLTATVSDDVGVDKVEFFLNGKSIGEGVLKDGLYRLTAPVTASGDVTFSVRASDAAQNIGEDSETTHAEAVLRVAGGTKLAHDFSCPPSLAFAAGTAWIAHTNASAGEPGVSVAKLTNNSWKSLGLANAAGEQAVIIAMSRCPSLAVSSDGIPYVAFSASSAGKILHVVRAFKDGKWESVRSVVDGNGGIDAHLAIDSQDRPILARVNAGQQKVTVERLQDGNWEPLSATIASFGNAKQVRLAVRPDGGIVLAIADNGITLYELHDTDVQPLAPFVGGPKPLTVLQVLDLNVDASNTVLTYNWFGGGTNWVISESLDSEAGAWSYLGSLDEQAHQDTHKGSATLLDGKLMLAVEGVSAASTDVRRWQGTSWTQFQKLPIPYRQMDLQAESGQLFAAYKDTEQTVTVARVFIQ